MIRRTKMNWISTIQTCCLLTFFLLGFNLANGQQYYLRGEVKDESNNALVNARILLHSSNYLYYSDSSGVFEILISAGADSVTVSADGFKPLSMGLEAGQYQYIILNTTDKNHGTDKRRLSCLTLNLDLLLDLASGKDAYSASGSGSGMPFSKTGGTSHSLVENHFLETRLYPQTSFALNPGKVSFNNLQRYINLGTMVPPDAIRIEELLNYFNLDYQLPPPDSSFQFVSYLTQCPWNRDNQLLLLHANARKNDFDKVPPTNLVFLIDATGSMDLPNKLPLLKSALKFLAGNLREKDTISIVAFGRSTSVLLPPTPGSMKKPILKAIDQLKAGGNIPGDIALRNAYTIAENQFIQGGNNRVILITDGDFNSGLITEEEMEKMIMMHKRWGIYLSCLGIGMDNKKEEKLNILVERGSGNLSYVDDEKNVEKALMREFASVVYNVADSAYFTIQLDSNLVKSYRVIGFENNLNAIRDSADHIRAGEVGSGSSIMAIVEITPTPDSVRKQLLGASPGIVELHYNQPGDTLSIVSDYEIKGKLFKLSSIPDPCRFAISVAWCGQILKNSSFVGRADWSGAISLGSDSYSSKDPAQKEFIELMRKARRIYAIKASSQ